MSDDVSQKARMLAEGISAVMNGVAFFWLVTVVVTAHWLLYATWRYQWLARPAVPTGQPPYR